jgi:hypothetical protein
VATVINSHAVNYSTYRWLAPLIFKLVDEITAENIEILHDVAQNQFVVVFEVQRQSYRFQVPDTRQLPLDLDSSSIQELIVEIKLRHF